MTPKTGFEQSLIDDEDKEGGGGSLLSNMRSSHDVQ
jgi:hypothetical protein